jgi:hypothetical protein
LVVWNAGGYRSESFSEAIRSIGAMAVQLDVDGAVYSYGNSNSTFDLYILPEFKYTFDNPGFQPYLLAGRGIEPVL